MSGSRCARCSAVHFPAVPVCPECGAESEPVALTPAGKVETWTTVHRAPPDEPVPYVLVWVWTEDGVRILARWRDPGEPAVGAAVGLVTEAGKIVAVPAAETVA